MRVHTTRNAHTPGKHSSLIGSLFHVASAVACSCVAKPWRAAVGVTCVAGRGVDAVHLGTAVRLQLRLLYTAEKWRRKQT